MCCQGLVIKLRCCFLFDFVFVSFIEPSWFQGTKLMNPEIFPLIQGVIAPGYILIYNLKFEVFKWMTLWFYMSSHRTIFASGTPRAVVVKPLVEWCNCLSHILYLANSTCKEVYTILSFTGGVWVDGKFLLCNGTLKCTFSQCRFAT